MADGRRLAWRKSTFCGSSACVEVALGADGVTVRDSGDYDGPRLEFDRGGWTAFLGELSAGRLERRPA